MSTVGRPWNHEQRARAALTAVVDPDRRWAARSLADDGAEHLLAGLREGRLPDGAEEESREALAARARACDVEALRRRADAVGARLVVPGDDAWPPWPVPGLPRGVPAPPVALWVRGGDPAELLDASIAVVGSRAATSYGTRVAGEMGHDLAEAGWTVVSGAAYGIDGAAHRGALAAGGPTVAVLAGGSDVPYPSGHAALLERIAAEGAVLTEAPPGAASRRARFLTRNRLIAAYTAGTVLVEAAARSGALSTAAAARKLGRTVCVVPGPVTSGMSAGCHAFLRREATDGDAPGGRRLVTRPAEVLEDLGPLGLFAPEVPRETRPLDALEPRQRAVVEALPAAGALSTDAVAREAGVDGRAALQDLAVLAGRGLVVREEGGWRLGPRARRGSGRRPA